VDLALSMQHFVSQIVTHFFRYFITSQFLLNVDSPVAIKVVSLATIHNAEAEGLSESILNEIRMAKLLSRLSKHVVHMYDFDFHRQTGLSFIIMELGEKDLEVALLQRPPLSSAERKAIWRQLVNIAITLYHRQIVI
jgi:serine/threonine protein kinase